MDDREFNVQVKLTAWLESKLDDTEEFIRACLAMEDAGYSHELMIALMTLTIDYDALLNGDEIYYGKSEENDSSRWS